MPFLVIPQILQNFLERLKRQSPSALDAVFPVHEDDFLLGPLGKDRRQSQAEEEMMDDEDRGGRGSGGVGVGEGGWNVQILRSITSDSVEFDEPKSRLLHSR